MHHSDELLRQQILNMADNDLAVRRELVADGSLNNHGYHPRMEAVHTNNAARLSTIIEQHGWPGESLVGADGARAAWLIAQHAISNPQFMRQCFSLLKQAASEYEAPEWQVAFLEDRILMYEGKPQIYGTQFELDKNGELVPYKIESPESVNDRRRAVGLNTLEDRAAEMQKQNADEKLAVPKDWNTEYESWLRSVGWRK